jgi:cellulose synthase/poly-beta-1,6-N-acetylglucosamine synthase-like glycosyltransferase
VVFLRNTNRIEFSENVDVPGVSIIIAVKNGAESLAVNLPYILAQSYSSFEVMIVNDHSTTDETKKLEALKIHFPQISLHHSDRNSGKKNALTLGVEKAKYEMVLCTDADCCPAGKEWIKNMVAQSKDMNLVLGYSPYVKRKGVLNFFIRFETVMTGIQYLSWAMMGRPYMGVGRNMLYGRSFFLAADPYKDQHHVPYGDDDLWVQKAGSNSKASVCFEKESHVFSVAERTWLGWIRQKHRHLSAGHHYHLNRWWQPGLYGMALIIHWILAPILLLLMFSPVMFIFFFAALSIRWYVYHTWTVKLEDKDTEIAYPLLELGYALYLAAMGIVTLVSKKKTWN